MTSLVQDKRAIIPAIILTLLVVLSFLAGLLEHVLSLQSNEADLGARFLPP